MIIVYSVITNTPLRLLRSESEVTQICTPGDDTLLIVGTVHGSINLYDLKELDTGAASNADDMDYETLLKALQPDA